MREITRTVYTFDELGEKAKARAIEKMKESNAEDWDGTDMYEDFEAIANIFGIELKQYTRKTIGGKQVSKPAINYSGFSSQGDGASFEGVYAYAKDAQTAIRSYTNDAELHAFADRLEAVQRNYDGYLTAEIVTGRYGGNYSHSGTMSVDCDLDVRDRIYELENVLMQGAEWENASRLDLDDEQVQVWLKNPENPGYAEAVELLKLRDWEQSGDTITSEDADEMQSIMRDFADWMYKSLKDEYDYQTSDEVAKDSIENGDYEFEENGDTL